jgi:hypothetical protein
VLEPGRGINGLLEIWYLDGAVHRKDGPAMVYESGRGWDDKLEEWWLNNEKHRVGGPAVVYEPGRSVGDILEEWWRGGKLHRAMGSAKVYLASPETTCRTIFAWWMANREYQRADRDAKPRTGGRHWEVWKGVKRGAMAKVLRQLAVE